MSCLSCFRTQKGYDVRQNQALLEKNKEPNKYQEANPADPADQKRARRESKASLKGLRNIFSNFHLNKPLPFSPQDLLDFVNDPDHTIHITIPERNFVSQGSFTNINLIDSTSQIILQEHKPFIEGQALTEIKFKLNSKDNSYTISYSLTQSWSAIPSSANKLTGSFTVLTPKYSQTKNAKFYTFTISPPVFEPALGSTKTPPNPFQGSLSERWLGMNMNTLNNFNKKGAHYE